MVAKFKKNKRERNPKRFLKLFIISACFILIIVFLIRSNLKISDVREGLNLQIARLEREIKAAQEKSDELKAKNSGSEYYIEKVAREQLNMMAHGEKVVVVEREDNNQESQKKGGNSWDPRAWWEWLKEKVNK